MADVMIIQFIVQNAMYSVSLRGNGKPQIGRPIFSKIPEISVFRGIIITQVRPKENRFSSASH